MGISGSFNEKAEVHQESPFSFLVILQDEALKRNIGNEPNVMLSADNILLVQKSQGELKSHLDTKTTTALEQKGLNQHKEECLTLR